MNTLLVENEDWTCEDEIWMQDQIDHRERERADRRSMNDYQRVRNARNGERVRLLVEHPFRDEVWTIWGPAPEPGFYYLCCRFQVYQKWTGIEQCFHESELTPA
jgi:hypothetical protein